MNKEVCEIWNDIQKIFEEEEIINDTETMQHVINILDKVIDNENE